MIFKAFTLELKFKTKIKIKKTTKKHTTKDLEKVTCSSYFENSVLNILMKNTLFIF